MARRGDVATNGDPVTTSGSVDAPAIVFLHGTRLSRAVWTPQLAVLGNEFHAIAMDLPGHGERAAEAFSLEAAVEAAADVIRRRASGGRAVVVGLSLGGYVAMALAAGHPELVRGLVVAGASADPIGINALPYRALAGALSRLRTSRPDRLNAWFFRWRYAASISDPIIAGGFWPTGGAAALRSLVGQRFGLQLAGFQGPTLIVNGQYDVMFRLTAPRFAATSRKVRRLQIRGATHLSNLDRPAAFSHAVREFARSANSA